MTMQRSCYQISNTQKIGKHDMFIFITHAGVMSFKFSNYMYRRKRRKPSSYVQFENESDVTPSVINMSIPRFPAYQVF